MKTIAFAALLLAAATGSAFAADFETKAGVEVRTVNRVHFDAACQRTGYPIFAVVTPPANGALDIRREPITLKTAVDHKQCIGKTVEGVVVVYKPKPGFKGTDRFTLRRERHLGGAELTEVAVTVK